MSEPYSAAFTLKLNRCPSDEPVYPCLDIYPAVQVASGRVKVKSVDVGFRAAYPQIRICKISCLPETVQQTDLSSKDPAVYPANVYEIYSTI